jgi:hypothetical protein
VSAVNDNDFFDSNTDIIEIERLIDEFKEKFKAGTTDADNFISITEIELLWSELQDKTNNIYSDMIRKLMSEVNERDLIRKKKREYESKKIILRTHKKNTVTVITILGKMTYSRYTLIPNDNESKKNLVELNGLKSVTPLDSYLGLAGLPYKITPSAMLKIAFWAQNQGSYQRAEDAITETMHINVNDDTIRTVANYVGDIVFKNDCKKAEEALVELENGKIHFKNNVDGVVYIQTDGAALNTRFKDENGSTWRENKLGEVFSSKDMYFWTDKKGKRQHRIIKKEYISFIGAASEFKKHLFACALRGGYGRFKKTVILSDGATWIRNMAEEIFPDAQQILDFYHLCENVNSYAKHIFNMDESKYKPWAKNICDLLKNSEYRIVLNELNPFKDKKPYGCPVNLYAYISNNIKNIDYVTYEKNGYFIGSGAIESGNKIILQDRLKRAGMRWNTVTAQAILTLKTKAESNLWYSDVQKPFLTDCFLRSRIL